MLVFPCSPKPAQYILLGAKNSGLQVTSTSLRIDILIAVRSGGWIACASLLSVTSYLLYGGIGLTQRSLETEMNSQRIMFALAFSFIAQQGTAQAAPQYDDEIAQLRQMYCASKGGTDITELGSLTLGLDVSIAVVCAGISDGAEQAQADVVQTQAACMPWSAVCGTLRPPSGTYTITSANPTFPTSCAADLNVRSRPGGGTSTGTSTFDCRAYVAGGSAAGCNVRWSGPSSFPVGSISTASVSFNCLATGPGSRGTAMDYEYVDDTYPAVRFSDQATSSLTIVLQ